MTRKLILGDTPEWHAARNRVVTGTWVAALFGEHPWKSREDLRNRLEFGSTTKPSRYMWWGRNDEKHIIHSYGQLMALNVVPSNVFAERGSLGATIDGHIVGFECGQEPVEAEEVTSAPAYWTRTAKSIREALEASKDPLILEIKTTSEKNRSLWGRDIPRAYWWQVQSQMWCHHLTRTVVVAKLGAHDIRHHLVEYEQGLGETMEAAAAEMLEEAGIK